MVYSRSIKICASGFDELLETIFCWVWKHFPFEKLLEEVVVGWQEVRWIWWIWQNFVAQFVQLLKCRLCGMCLSVVVENGALSFDQCWLQALWFSVHPIDLLSMLLRCHGFARIQKVVVDQTFSGWTKKKLESTSQSRICTKKGPDQTVTMTSSWCRFGFWKCFGASSWSDHRAGSH